MLKVSSPEKRKEMQKNKEKRQQKEKKMHPKIKKRNKQEEKIPANNPNCTHSARGLERLCITSNIRADCVFPSPVAAKFKHPLSLSSADLSQRARLNETHA